MPERWVAIQAYTSQVQNGILVDMNLLTLHLCQPLFWTSIASPALDSLLTSPLSDGDETVIVWLYEAIVTESLEGPMIRRPLPDLSRAGRRIAGELPVTEPIAVKPPTGELPVTEPIAVKPPAGELPVTEPIAVKPPGGELPAAKPITVTPPAGFTPATCGADNLCTTHGPGSHSASLVMPAGTWLFCQGNLDHRDALPDILEWFVREAWWTRAGGSGPLVVRLVHEDGGTVVQVLRTLHQGHLEQGHHQFQV
jgi:hypothetical protein